MTNYTEPRDEIPAGWILQSHRDTFSGHAGPFYFRPLDDKRPGVGFLSAPSHANAHGMIHGGALLTLADMSLWDICRRAGGPFRAVTLTLNCEFVAPGPIGRFIAANGEAVKIGKSIMFARGDIRCGDDILLTYSGSLKRFS
ncbi:MAG: PaaI family thioesterase [Parvularculaceae bacterium]|nr:PaaI family thioesterase [Parvularculaceae bacterium]